MLGLSRAGPRHVKAPLNLILFVTCFAARPRGTHPGGRTRRQALAGPCSPIIPSNSALAQSCRHNEAPPSSAGTGVRSSGEVSPPSTMALMLPVTPSILGTHPNLTLSWGGVLCMGTTWVVKANVKVLSRPPLCKSLTKPPPPPPPRQTPCNHRHWREVHHL